MGVLDGEDYELLRHAAPLIGEKFCTSELRFVRTREAILAGHVIYIDELGAMRAGNGSGRVTGIAICGAGPGKVLKYRPAGFVYLPDWSAVTGTPLLTPGATYFLRAEGTISTAPPISGYVREIGEANTDKTLYFRLGVRVKL